MHLREHLSAQENVDIQHHSPCILHEEKRYENRDRLVVLVATVIVIIVIVGAIAGATVIVMLFLIARKVLMRMWI